MEKFSTLMGDSVCLASHNATATNATGRKLREWMQAPIGIGTSLPSVWGP